MNMDADIARGAQRAPLEFVDKVVPKAVEREEGSESNYTGGMLRPCREV